MKTGKAGAEWAKVQMKSAAAAAAGPVSAAARACAADQPGIEGARFESSGSEDTGV